MTALHNMTNSRITVPVNSYLLFLFSIFASEFGLVSVGAFPPVSAMPVGRGAAADAALRFLEHRD